MWFLQHFPSAGRMSPAFRMSRVCAKTAAAASADVSAGHLAGQGTGFDVFGEFSTCRKIFDKASN